MQIREESSNYSWRNGAKRPLSGSADVKIKSVASVAVDFHNSAYAYMNNCQPIAAAHNEDVCG